MALVAAFINHSAAVLPSPYIHIYILYISQPLRRNRPSSNDCDTSSEGERERCESPTTAHEGDKDKYDSKDGLLYDYRIMRPRKDLQRALIIQHIMTFDSSS